MIIEAILTSIAWRKGWGPVALLPIAFAIFMGIIGGAAHAMALAIVGDVIAYILLIAMIAKARKRVTPASPAAVASADGNPSAA